MSSYLNGRYDYAMNLIANCDYKEAIKILEELIQSGHNIGNCLYSAGVCYEYNDQGIRRGPGANLDKAFEYYQKAIKAGTSEDDGARFNMAIIMNDKGNYRESKPILENLLIKEPWRYDLNGMLGIVLINLGEFKDAARVLEIALELNPEDYTAMYNLGLAYRNAGDKRKSLEIYQQFLDNSLAYLQLFPYYRDVVQNARMEVNKLKFEIATQSDAVDRYQSVGETKKVLEKTLFPPRFLQVFLCHSSGDKKVVRELYDRLNSESNIEPWLDQNKLIPGQDWDLEIRNAIRASDVVVVCLSNEAINKESYVQKEIVRALEVAEEKPEGTIFVIPLKLEECMVPMRLHRWQWVNYFEEDGYRLLMQALQLRAKKLKILT